MAYLTWERGAQNPARKHYRNHDQQERIWAVAKRVRAFNNLRTINSDPSHAHRQ